MSHRLSSKPVTKLNDKPSSPPGSLFDTDSGHARGDSGGVVEPLEGWSRIPAGYGATFELAKAPFWLRVWFNAPFVDRFAYPVVVSRGYGRLHPHPGIAPEDREQVGPGWRIDPMEAPAQEG
jgi:hypothetical protein